MTPLFASKPAGDRAFERLYKAHVQDVYRYALLLLRNRADAEDVAQTTFLKAYRALRGGERPRHPRQWLFAIAHNTCRTRARDATRRPQEVAFEEHLTSDLRAREDSDVDARELVHALGALSFNQRAALVMRELEGRTYAEIAEVLEVSSSAVETLLFRARRALREQLEGTLDCGAAERAISLKLDGRLDSQGVSALRAHLRECGECASLARRERARRTTLRSLGPLSLPASLASWGGGGVGVGLGAKAAAVVAAGIAAAGTAGDSAGEAAAVQADRPSTPAPIVRVERRAASASLPTGPVEAVRLSSAASLEATAAKSRPGRKDAVPGAARRGERPAVSARRAADERPQAGGRVAPLPLPVRPPVDLPSPPALRVEVPALPVVPPAAPAPVPVPEPTVPPAPSVLP